LKAADSKYIALTLLNVLLCKDATKRITINLLKLNSIKVVLSIEVELGPFTQNYLSKKSPL
jgi:hypothetical protein